MALCNITHTFKDSAGVPVAGTFHWQLDGMLFLVNGDIHLPIESTATVTSTGVLNINLEASESQGITYHFWFIPADAVDDIPILDFRSTVPNKTSEKLSEMIPLQLTTDQLPSGLRRLAQIIMDNEDYSSILRLIKPEGIYDPDKFYTEGSLVTYDGGSWLYIAKTITKGNAPNVESTYWQQLGSRGLPGSGTTGNDTPYDASGWLGALDAPTRNSLAGTFVERSQPTTTFTSELPPSNLSGNLLLPLSYLLGNFAVLDSPELLGNPTAPNKGTGDGTNSIATCKHVLDSITEHSSTLHTNHIVFNSNSLAGTPVIVNSTSGQQINIISLTGRYRGIALFSAHLGANGSNNGVFSVNLAQGATSIGFGQTSVENQTPWADYSSLSVFGLFEGIDPVITASAYINSGYPVRVNNAQLFTISVPY